MKKDKFPSFATLESILDTHPDAEIRLFVNKQGATLTVVSESEDGCVYRFCDFIEKQRLHSFFFALATETTYLYTHNLIIR